MRIRVEFAAEIVSDLGRNLPSADRDDFFRQLEQVCREPIDASIPAPHCTAGRNPIRSFAFGASHAHLAIFTFCRGDLIKILEFRKQTPIPKRMTTRAANRRGAKRARPSTPTRRDLARVDMAGVYEILNRRFESGFTDTAERHNEHQP